jgi:hypothetical protein
MEKLNKIDLSTCGRNLMETRMKDYNINGKQVSLDSENHVNIKKQYIEQYMKRIKNLIDYMERKYTINNILIGDDFCEYILDSNQGVVKTSSKKNRDELLTYYNFLVKNLKQGYDMNNFIETVPFTSPCGRNDDTSFVLGKGKIISICMQNTQNMLHDFEFVWHVFVHELSHISDKNSVNHDGKFYNAFQTLKRCSYEAGISPNLKLEDNTTLNYCGIMGIKQYELSSTNSNVASYTKYPSF